MGYNKDKARALALNWWKKSRRADALCDLCGVKLGKGAGYLCKSSTTVISPDLLCENCFDRHSSSTAFEGVLTDRTDDGDRSPALWAGIKALALFAFVGGLYFWWWSWWTIPLSAIVAVMGAIILDLSVAFINSKIKIFLLSVAVILAVIGVAYYFIGARRLAPDGSRAIPRRAVPSTGINTLITPDVQSELKALWKQGEQAKQHHDYTRAGLKWKQAVKLARSKPGFSRSAEAIQNAINKLPNSKSQPNQKK